MKSKPKTSYIIFRILRTPTLISIVVFGLLCLESYLVTKNGNHNFAVGFPYKFYGRPGGDVPMIVSVVFFITDAILIWTISVGGYFYWLANIYKPKLKSSRNIN